MKEKYLVIAHDDYLDGGMFIEVVYAETREDALMKANKYESFKYYKMAGAHLLSSLEPGFGDKWYMDSDVPGNLNPYKR